MGIYVVSSPMKSTSIQAPSSSLHCHSSVVQASDPDIPFQAQDGGNDQKKDKRQRAEEGEAQAVWKEGSQKLLYHHFNYITLVWSESHDHTHLQETLET